MRFGSAGLSAARFHRAASERRGEFRSRQWHWQPEASATLCCRGRPSSGQYFYKRRSTDGASCLMCGLHAGIVLQHGARLSAGPAAAVAHRTHHPGLRRGGGCAEALGLGLTRSLACTYAIAVTDVRSVATLLGVACFPCTTCDDPLGAPPHVRPGYRAGITSDSTGTQHPPLLASAGMSLAMMSRLA
jgi:hypothetical protein